MLQVVLLDLKLPTMDGLEGSATPARGWQGRLLLVVHLTFRQMRNKAGCWRDFDAPCGTKVIPDPRRSLTKGLQSRPHKAPESAKALRKASKRVLIMCIATPHTVPY